MERVNQMMLHQSELPDELIVERIRNGEKELFEILMKRYNQRLFRVVRGYLKEDEEIRDVMQNAYLKAFENLTNFRGDASFYTWLIKIGINESLMRLRKLKKKQHYLSFLNHEEEPSAFFSQTDNMNPEQKAIQHETHKFIEQAVDDLPEKYRIVYILREVEGLDIQETAASLGLTESNVKVRIFRAKELLKKTLLNLSADINIYEFGGRRCDQLREEVMKKILAMD